MTRHFYSHIRYDAYNALLIIIIIIIIDIIIIIKIYI